MRIYKLILNEYHKEILIDAIRVYEEALKGNYSIVFDPVFAGVNPPDEEDINYVKSISKIRDPKIIDKGIENLSKYDMQYYVKALDLYSRIASGDFMEILGVNSFFSYDGRLRRIGEKIFGLGWGFCYGISHAGDRFKVAYDMQQVIRHQIWKDFSSDKYSVCSDVCQVNTKHDLIKVEFNDN